MEELKRLLEKLIIKINFPIIENEPIDAYKVVKYAREVGVINEQQFALIEDIFK